MKNTARHKPNSCCFKVIELESKLAEQEREIVKLKKDCSAYWEMLKIAKSKVDAYHDIIVQYPHDQYAIGSSETVPIPKTESFKSILDELFQLRSRAR